MKNKKYYDDFFASRDASVHNHPDRFLRVSELLSGRVLDIACGTGHLADYYLGDYVGVDIADSAIANAKIARRKSAVFMQSDFLRTDFGEPQLFDCVHMGEFLEHILEDDVLFARIKKVIRPNGRIVCSVPNGDRVPDESHCRTFTIPQIRKTYCHLGRLTFYNWSGARDRIIFSIDLGEVKVNDVSLVMIVKDEEVGLERAILSAIEYVDNIVISVDTKTTDRTGDIASLYADELKYHEWKDDFSMARNEAQANVKTKWILFLDGHEHIESIGNLRESLKSEADGIMVTVKMETGLTFMFPRIYKNGITFTGAVHNLNTVTTKIFNTKFVIKHDRENGQAKDAIARREAQRDEMLPRIMGDRIKNNPKDLRALFHLGNYYMLLKDWKQAIGFYKQYLKYGDMPEECYLMALNKSLCHQMLNQNVRALWSAHKADRFLPNRWETARIYGNIYFLQGRWEKAVKWLVRSFDQNNRRYLYEPFPRDLQISWDMIAMCFMNLGQKKEAVTALERAIDCAKNEEEKAFYQTKLKFMQML